MPGPGDRVGIWFSCEMMWSVAKDPAKAMGETVTSQAQNLPIRETSFATRQPSHRGR